MRANLLHHIGIVKRSGISPVVCINAFVKDTLAEIAKIWELCEAAGARGAVSRDWNSAARGPKSWPKPLSKRVRILPN